MKRINGLIVFFIIICIMMVSTSAPCYAHPTAEEHNKELESVLFESGYSKYQSNEIKKYVTALEYASNLTIDQFGGDGEDKFEFLRKNKMGGLPLRFSSLDYNEDLSGSGKKINANTHRLYTHQGWDVDYGNSKVKSFWKTRRNILLGTVESIFNFGKISSIVGYDKKCNSLAGIIYYVHILGDYDEADNYKKIIYLTDIAGRNDKNDMTTALKSYVEILFEDQKTSNDYRDLMKELDAISKRAGKIVRSTGGVNTDEEFEEYHQYAVDLMETLKKYMPNLLKREEFFKKVFYPN